MNKPVQILLLCALLPISGQAKEEETLEQRKQRIMRKYLRENAEVSQSDLYVPSDMPEDDEKVTESEEYGETKDLFERHEGGTMPQTARRPMPRIRKKASSNWLLDDTEADMESADPYADPFADPFARDDSRSSDSRRDWSQWDSSRQDSSTSQYDRRYGRESTSDPYGSRGQRSETWSSSRGSAYDSREDTDSGFTRYGSQDSSSYSTGQSPYGADRSRSTYSTGTQGMQESRTYGSSPDTGLLTTPYPQLNSSGSSRDSGAQGYGSERSRGYTPSYQSPYGRSSEQQQRSSPWGTSSSQPEQQEEYSQPSPLQKYQDKNKGFNPMRDDDYLKQIMPQN